jgi:hypothetical protein
MAGAGLSHAINFRDVTRAPDGIYPIIYPIWFSADKITDSNGDTFIDNLGLDSYKLVLKTLYIKGELTVTFIVPFGTKTTGKFADTDSGLGDIVLGASYFLPVEGWHMAPIIAFKFPTGEYDKHSGVNIRNGQKDIYAKFYATKFYEKLSLHTALYYIFRTEEHDDGLKAGNEFHAECLVTFPIAKGMRLGPSVNYMKSDDNELNGSTLSNSAVEKLSVGGELTYLMTPKLSTVLNVMKDIESENSAEGMLVLGKISYFF